MQLNLSRACSRLRSLLRPRRTLGVRVFRFGRVKEQFRRYWASRAAYCDASRNRAASEDMGFCTAGYVRPLFRVRTRNRRRGRTDRTGLDYYVRFVGLLQTCLHRREKEGERERDAPTIWRALVDDPKLSPQVKTEALHPPPAHPPKKKPEPQHHPNNGTSSKPRLNPKP